MTNADIFNRILSDASGQPVAEVTGMTELLANMFGAQICLNEEISDAEAEKLLATLREELPGIRAWLAKCDLMAETQRDRHASNDTLIRPGGE